MRSFLSHGFIWSRWVLVSSVPNVPVWVLSISISSLLVLSDLKGSSGSAIAGDDAAGSRSGQVISIVNGDGATEDGVLSRKVSKNISGAIKSVSAGWGRGEVGDSASIGILELVGDSVGINLLQRVEFSAGACAVCTKMSEGVDSEGVLLVVGQTWHRTFHSDSTIWLLSEIEIVVRGEFANSVDTNVGFNSSVVFFPSDSRLVHDDWGRVLLCSRVPSLLDGGERVGKLGGRVVLVGSGCRVVLVGVVGVLILVFARTGSGDRGDGC